MFEDMSSTLREELLQQCEKLPPAQFREVLDFAEFLLTRPSVRRGTKNGGSRELRGYIGGVSHGSLAQDIDHDLYGSVR